MQTLTSPQAGPLAGPIMAAQKPISTAIVCGVLRLVDAAAILGAAVVAYFVWLIGAEDIDWSQYAVVASFGALLAINLFQMNGAYQFEVLRRPLESLRRTLSATLVVAALLIAASYFTKTSEEYSRGWSTLWFALAVPLLLVIRMALFCRIRRWAAQGRFYRNVVIVGAGPIGQRLLRYFNSTPDAGVRVLGVFDDRVRRSPDQCVGIPVLGNLDNLLDFARRNPIDTVIVALPWSAELRLVGIFAKLRALPVDVRLCPDLVGFHLKRREVSHFDQLTMLNVLDKPLSDWRLVAKELEDRILAALILTLIAPVMLVIAALIKLDSPGPVFFHQKRYGFNNQLIEVFKFRTMYHDKRDEKAEQLTQRNDPRITRFGAFLRRTSLDELPQFINVLRGEMSIVGPRPHALSAKAAGMLYQDAVSEYAARHRVKPGITGWAQINGWRGETETLEQIQKRVEHDLYYIDNWSIRLDLKIIALTILTGFAGRHAF